MAWAPFWLNGWAVGTPPSTPPPAGGGRRSRLRPIPHPRRHVTGGGTIRCRPTLTGAGVSARHGTGHLALAGHEYGAGTSTRHGTGHLATIARMHGTGRDTVLLARQRIEDELVLLVI